jgi:hypothetical protein
MGSLTCARQGAPCSNGYRNRLRGGNDHDSDYANVRYFYKVELWTKDDQRVVRLLHAGNRIDAARAVFNAAVKHRPGGRYTIR